MHKYDHVQGVHIGHMNLEIKYIVIFQVQSGEVL